MIDIGQVKTMSGSTFEYRRSLAGKESLVSQGPLKEPLLVEVILLMGTESGYLHWWYQSLIGQKPLKTNNSIVGKSILGPRSLLIQVLAPNLLFARESRLYNWSTFVVFQLSLGVVLVATGVTVTWIYIKQMQCCTDTTCGILNKNHWSTNPIESFCFLLLEKTDGVTWLTLLHLDTWSHWLDHKYSWFLASLICPWWCSTVLGLNFQICLCTTYRQIWMSLDWLPLNLSKAQAIWLGIILYYFICSCCILYLLHILAYTCCFLYCVYVLLG